MFECYLLKVELIKREDGSYLKRITIDAEKFAKEKQIPCSKNCNPCLGTMSARELAEKGWSGGRGKGAEGAEGGGE